MDIVIQTLTKIVIKLLLLKYVNHEHWLYTIKLKLDHFMLKRWLDHLNTNWAKKNCTPMYNFYWAINIQELDYYNVHTVLSVITPQTIFFEKKFFN